MAEMTHEFSQFPFKILEQNNFKDVDDSIASVINQIKSLQQQGLYNQAQRIIEQNKDVIGKYMCSSDDINKIVEELRNTQIYAKQVQQSIHMQDDEPDCTLGDVWIGE